MNRVETKVMDIQPPKGWTRNFRLRYERRRIKKFFAGLEVRGGIVGGKAVMFCYNREAPEMSYIITEHL